MAYALTRTIKAMMMKRSEILGNYLNLTFPWVGNIPLKAWKPLISHVCVSPIKIFIFRCMSKPVRIQTIRLFGTLFLNFRLMRGCQALIPFFQDKKYIFSPIALRTDGLVDGRTKCPLN